MPREIVKATILEVDIRGFSSFCKKIKLPQAGNFIDEYFSIVRNALDKVASKKNEIAINRFMGDGFLIFIFDETDGANKAIDAAFNIRDTLNKKFTKEYNFTNAGVAMAIGEGDILYDQFGEECSKDSLVCPPNWQGETTGIGVPINLVNRLLGVASKNQILVTEEVHNQIRENYIWTEFDAIHVKGFKDPLIPYLILKKGMWKEERYCSSCMHCDNSEYCDKNYYYGVHHRQKSLLYDKFELTQYFLCDERIEYKGNFCKGCEINKHTEGNPSGEGCILNLSRGTKGDLNKRTCCPDCNKYATCIFNLHRGKNHLPKSDLQAVRKRYCCESCKYYDDPIIKCRETKMKILEV